MLKLSPQVANEDNRLEPLDITRLAHPVEASTATIRDELTDYVLDIEPKRNAVLAHVEAIRTHQHFRDSRNLSAETVCNYCFTYNDPEVEEAVRTIEPLLLAHADWLLNENAVLTGLSRHNIEKLTDVYRLLHQIGVPLSESIISNINSKYTSMLDRDPAFYSLLLGGPTLANIQVLNKLNPRFHLYAPYSTANMFNFHTTEFSVPTSYNIPAAAAYRLLDPNRFHEFVAQVPRFWSTIKEEHYNYKCRSRAYYSVAILTASEVEVDWEGTGRVTMAYKKNGSIPMSVALPEGPEYA